MPVTRDQIIEQLRANPSATIPGLEFDLNNEPSGDGGTSLVFSANQRIETTTIKRAVKFFAPRPSVAAKISNLKEHNEAAFSAEAWNLTTLRHENLLPIISGGTVTIAGEEVKYLVSDYVQGGTLRSLISGNNLLSTSSRRLAVTSDANLEARPKGLRVILSEQDVLDLAIGITKAIEYMHRERFVHCDIKPENVFLRFSGARVSPIVGDLGLTKNLDQLPAMVGLAGTTPYMPEEVRRLEIAGGVVPASHFQQIAHGWDLFSLRKTLRELFSAFQTDTAPAWYLAAVKELSKDSNSCAELLERLEFYHPRSHTLARVPELAGGMASNSVQPIPLQQPILSSRFRSLFMHRAMLRLNSVNQLLMKQTLFPGARHSRYEHALGVYENVRQYLIAMLDDTTSLQHLSTQAIELALVSAALCQIHRVPYSICIDELRLRDKSLYPGLDPSAILDRAISDIENHKRRSVSDVLGEQFPLLDQKALKTVVLGKLPAQPTHEQIFVNSLLNSSLDARVIDFIRRDSLHSGAFGGDPINFQELTAGFTIWNHRLAIKPFAIPVAEKVLCVRYWLFQRIYWNRANRFVAAAMRRLFFLCAECSEFVQWLQENILQTDEREILDRVNIALQSIGKPELQELTRMVSIGSSTIYTMILDGNSYASWPIQAIKGIRQLTPHEHIELEQSLCDIVKRNIGSEHIVPNHAILVDIPMEDASRKLGDDIIVADKREKNPLNLQASSPIVEGVVSAFNKKLLRVRVFCHPDVARSLNESDALRQVTEQMTEALSLVPSMSARG